MSKVVLHIHQKFLPYKGGSTQRLLNLIQNASEKYTHIVVCINSEKVESFSQIGNIKIYRCEKYSDIPLLLFKLYYKYKIHIVHYHNYRPAFFGLVSKLLFPRAKTIFELHSIYIPTTKLGRLLTKVVHHACDEALVLSNSSVIALRKIGFKKKISVIYNGVDLDKFRNANSTSEIINRKNCIVGYIGSIEAFQGVENFCSIAKNVKNVRQDIDFIVIGGNRENHRKLESIAEGSVEFYEFFSPEVVPSLYKKFKCLLMTRPSLPETESAVPLKPIEALGAGIPVISTSVGGMQELKSVLGSKNIYLFESKEEIEKFILSGNLEQIQYNEEKHISLFDVNKQSELLENVYTELISGQ
ncbi:glycosyltransferase family 4 protein [Vibrio cholerae]|uniref:glycosyltransferase family 4 protein n=1 Tax=Vibrio cholerae TaxID=666 RepID=UPI001156C9C2|nr:glycosyltransferase family 4 protein [Vibrio cholerae]ELD3371661.1 glycosyltransferase family 4 protein [Vibrio cholerae]TQP52564.1 glycosyltransferase family 4 protein [Vibrio cholerae]TQP93805.1 glycosyltransferase family 4 protein [Vibrio cholerae]